MNRYSRIIISILVAPAFLGVASAQTADTVVEKALAAMGGRDALAKLTSRKATGTVTASTPGGDVSGPIEILLKAPNKSHVLMTLDLSAVGGGSMTIEQRFDGTAGYAMNSMQGQTEIGGKQLESMRNNVFPSPLLGYKEAGTKIDLLPTSKVGDKDATVLLITPKTGSAVRMFLDADTSLPVRAITTIDSPQTGGDVEQTTELSDYRTVDGVKVPFRLTMSNPAQTVTIAFDKVEHNVAIDDAVFGKK